MVYKYFPPQRSSFFFDPLISFSPPSLLNDPLDCMPVITLKDLDRHIDNIAQRNVNSVIARYGNTEEAETRIQNATRQMRERYQKHPETVIDMVLSIFKKNINADVGILSLAKSPDNELMWAHYTSGHEGFVVGLDEGNEFFKRRANDPLDCGILKDVEYTDERISIDVDNIVIPQELLFTKKNAWSYEKEVRMIRVLSTADKVIDNGNEKVFLFRVPKEAIKEVIFGVKCASEIITSITHTVKHDAAYRDVRLRKAFFTNESTFRIGDI
jgi:hypothetical protein